MVSLIRIAVLDDYQNIARPHFQKLLESQFEVNIFHDTLLPYNHPLTSLNVKSTLIARLKPFQVICSIRERTPFPRDLLEQLPNLKLLLTTGLGNRAIDVAAAKSLGIQVAGAPGKGLSESDSAVSKIRGPDSTTQHTVALILGIARNLATDDLAVKQGGWQTTINTSLSGKTFGTLGLGRLGLSVAKIMHQAFGMKVIAWSSSLTQEIADEKVKGAGLIEFDADGEKTIKVVSKEELFKTADVVSIHYVLSDRSRGIVGQADLALMKKSAFLINTSRGPLVHEESLLNTLKTGAILGAALDVFEIEPLPQNIEWRTTKWGVEGRSNVLLTPHTGYSQKEIFGRWYEENVENIERWHTGRELLWLLE